MIHNNFLISSKLNKLSALLLFIILAYLVSAGYSAYAQSSNRKFSISYKNNLLTLSAKDADLKNVLLNFADETDVKVWLPDYFKKRITIKFSKISIKESLEKLLRGLNHVIIYSGANKAQATVSGVYVFEKSKKSGRSNVRERQRDSRIRAFERRIESLKQNLSRIDVNSRRGKSYRRQIKRLEDNLERLQR